MKYFWALLLFPLGALGTAAGFIYQATMDAFVCGRKSWRDYWEAP